MPSAVLICASVPAKVMLPVPPPVSVVPPAVAFKVPKFTDKVTNILVDPASGSAMLKPVKALVVLGSNV